MEIPSHILAIAVGLGSVSLYLAAFFFPEVHRRHDFFWSGVGCFYALVLWACAGQITPTEWLGHLASLSLIGWLGWQTLVLRRKRTPITLQTPYTEDSWPTFRREMTGLIQDFLRQTALGRWWLELGGRAGSEPVANPQTGLRVSSLKEVGYEFLDSVEAVEPTTARRALEAGQRPFSVDSIASVPRSAVVKPPISTANRQPKPAVATAAPPLPTEQSGSGQRAQVPAKPMTGWQRGQVMVGWAKDVMGSMTAPKPKKPVIEIPPRSPSLPSPAARPASSHPGDSPLDKKIDDGGVSELDPASSLSSPAISIVDVEPSAGGNGAGEEDGFREVPTVSDRLGLEDSPSQSEDEDEDWI